MVIEYSVFIMSNPVVWMRQSALKCQHRVAVPDAVNSPKRVSIIPPCPVATCQYEPLNITHLHSPQAESVGIACGMSDIARASAEDPDFPGLDNADAALIALTTTILPRGNDE